MNLITSIGVELDGIKQRARGTARKRLRLYQAWQHPKRRPVLSGRMLEVLVGHFTPLMLLNRPALKKYLDGPGRRAN